MVATACGRSRFRLIVAFRPATATNRIRCSTSSLPDFSKAATCIATSALFIVGGYFGWRFLLPAACGFFIEQGRLFKQVITVDDYYSFASFTDALN